MKANFRMLLSAAVVALAGAFQPTAKAVLTIEIVDGVEGALPIAVVPFAWEGEAQGPGAEVAAIVRDDLRRSGQFEPTPPEQMVARPHRREDVNFGEWRLVDADYLVIGRMSPSGEGYRLEFELYNTHGQNRLLGYAVSAGAGELRSLAHHVSDLVYEELLGIQGAFSTRVAYVTATGSGKDTQYTLHVADADGHNPQTIVTSDEPLLSPAWSPDGRDLAYVSFESGNSAIYMQTLASGERRRLASFKGINGAPDISPDGRRMALALSKGGNLDIYVMDLASGELRQLTDHWGIDTEPRWTPDGRKLVFTSDRGGRPQLYTLDVASGEQKRLTFQGDYNARASLGPDGELVAMVHGQGNRYRIAVMDRETGVVRALSDGPLDESPSFAPNGSMILYATEEQGRGALAAVSADGSVRQKLRVSEGNVREPAWSPFLNR